MNLAQLWLKNPDRRVDCEKVIATTKQTADVNSIGSARITYTNTLELDPTQNNLTLFGFPNMLASKSTLPYTRQACKILDDGIETISNGICILRGRNNKGKIVINVYPDVYNFWDSIDGKNISDVSFEGDSINPSDWNAGGGAFTIHNYRNAASGVVAPVMNYGDFDFSSGSAPAMGPAGVILPSVYYKDVIDHIFSNAGYTKSGTIFADAKYLARVIPFGRQAFTYAAKFLNDRTITARAAGGQAIVNPVVPAAVNFTVLQNACPLGFWDGTNKYTPVDTDGNATTGPPNALYGLRVKCRLNVTVAGGTFTFGLISPTYGFLPLDGGAGPFGTGEYVFDSFNNLSVDTFPALNGEAVQIGVATQTGAPTVTINVGSSVTFAPHEEPPGPNQWNGGYKQYLYANALLPDISQKEFLKDFCARYNQLLFEKNGNITAKGVDEIIADRANAKNWTSKRNTDQDQDIKFQPLDYAQVNYFKYSKGDSLIGEDFGRGSLQVANANVPASKTIYTSPFANCQSSPFNGITMAVMEDAPYLDVYPSIGSVNMLKFTKEPLARILLVRDKYTAEPNVNYSGTAYGAYKVAYFDDPKEADTMRWQLMLDTFYPLFAAALQQAKLMNAEYNLSPVDFAAIDFSVPIFDTDQYYLVNQLLNFVSGQLTTAELLKL